MKVKIEIPDGKFCNGCCLLSERDSWCKRFNVRLKYDHETSYESTWDGSSMSDNTGVTRHYYTYYKSVGCIVREASHD